MRARARRAASGPRGVPRRFFHPCGREKSGVVKVNGVKLMNFEEKLDCSFFLFARMGGCLKKRKLFVEGC